MTDDGLEYTVKPDGTVNIDKDSLEKLVKEGGPGVFKSPTEEEVDDVIRMMYSVMLGTEPPEELGLNRHKEEDET